MPEAALKERKKAVDQVDMEDKPSWCASIPSVPRHQGKLVSSLDACADERRVHLDEKRATQHSVCRAPSRQMYYDRHPSPRTASNNTYMAYTTCTLGMSSMVDSAHRDWNAELEQWGWTCDPPASQRAGERDPNNPKTRKRKVSHSAGMLIYLRICVRLHSPNERAGHEDVEHEHSPPFCCCLEGEPAREFQPNLAT